MQTQHDKKKEKKKKQPVQLVHPNLATKFSSASFTNIKQDVFWE